MRKTLQTILLILFILIPRGGYCQFRNLVSGKVTYTTSRSMYISLKQAAVVSQGDTVLAGTNQSELGIQMM